MEQNEIRSYTDDQIKEMIDLNLSKRMNLDNLKAKGIKIGDHKLLKLMNEMRSEIEDQSIMTNDQIKDLIDLNLSVRKNLVLLQEKGVKIGDKKLQQLIKEKRSAIEAQEIVESAIETHEETIEEDLTYSGEEFIKDLLRKKNPDEFENYANWKSCERYSEELKGKTNDPVLNAIKNGELEKPEENADLSFGSPEKFSISFPRFNW